MLGVNEKTSVRVPLPPNLGQISPSISKVNNATRAIISPHARQINLSIATKLNLATGSKKLILYCHPNAMLYALLQLPVGHSQAWSKERINCTWTTTDFQQIRSMHHEASTLFYLGRYSSFLQINSFYPPLSPHYTIKW